MNIENNLLLQLFVDNMPTMCYYCGVDGTCAYVNKAFSDYTGFDSSQISNLRWIALGMIHPEDTQKVVDVWKASVENLQPYSVEYRLKSKHGMYRWVVAKAFFVRDPKTSKPLAWFGSIEDIHKYKTKLGQAMNLLEQNHESLLKLQSDAS